MEREPGPESDGGNGGHGPVEAEPFTGNYFVATYPPFSIWDSAGAAAYDGVLGREGRADDGTPLGYYVHIPFCVERCHYCYYLSHDDRPRDQEPYLETLLQEAHILAGRPALRGRRPDYVYFGGGTPSLLPAGRLRRLLESLRETLHWEGAHEITFECAPASVTREKIRILREAGVTRVSLGVQQLDDEVLRRNGRVHLVRDVLRAWEVLSAGGFPVRNLDLISGLVGETDGSFDRSLEQALRLDPEGITIYLLEIPHNTPLYHALRNGTLEDPVPEWEVKRSRLRRAFARMEAAGYTIRSAYAAVRDPERHRFLYQDLQYRGADLVGIGASSFSYLAGAHHQSLARLDAYLEAVGAGRLPLWRGRALGDEERMVREFVLSLKLGQVDAARFQGRYGVDIAERFEVPLRLLRDEGWLEASPAGVTLTREGLIRADRLLPLFYLPEHRGARYS